MSALGLSVRDFAVISSSVIGIVFNTVTLYTILSYKCKLVITNTTLVNTKFATVLTCCSTAGLELVQLLLLCHKN